MSKWLKQSTATTLLLGPFVDETDGQTAETGLTISQADVLLWKEGGTTLAQKNESTSCTHRSNGLYTCPVDATDTNTLGVLVVSVDEAGALPIRQDYFVLPANAYDALKAGTGVGVRADMRGLIGQTPPAVVGTTDNAGGAFTATVFEASDITEATADHYIGRSLYPTSGALVGQCTTITDYSLSGASRGHFTISGFPSGETIATGVTFLIA